MRTMKKRCLIFLIFIQLVLMTAAVLPAVSAKAGRQLKIAMVLWRGETQAEKGLKDGLKQFGYSVEYTTYNADQVKDRLAEILRHEIYPRATDFDYVYCFGTTAIAMAKEILGNKVPQLFNAVNAPVEAGIVNSMDAPGGNVSGVTNMVPIEKQLEQASRLVSIKRLGIIFNPREKNGVLRAEELSAISRRLNFEVFELNVSPGAHKLEKTLRKLVEKEVEVNVVYLASDSFVISQAEYIGEKLALAKIPSIAAQEESVRGGALMGYVPDYYELGRLAAGIVDQNQKGIKMGDIPIAMSRNPRFVVNKQTCEMMGIKLPPDLAADTKLIE